MTSVLPRLLLRRLHRRDLIAADAVLATLVSLLAVYAAVERPHAPVWLGVLSGILIGAPLALRRRWPVTVAGIVLGASVAALVSRTIPAYAAAAPAVAMGCAAYLVGLGVAGWRSAAALTACLAGLVVALVLVASDAAAVFVGLAFTWLTVGAPWALGVVVRERRAANAQAAARAAGQAASDERLRIARELHDIVAHSMSLIAVKAAIANHVAEARPEEARDALRVIEATSRGALRQLRQAVGTLRDEERYAPAPGLGALSALAEQAAAGGVDVRLDVRGAAEIPEAVGLSAYRIVQESLTNVVKHAAPTRCEVLVSVDAAAIHIEVTDRGDRPGERGGRGPGERGGGGLRERGDGRLGLIGIRERVAAHGGDFTAGPRDEGGFRVAVRLPYGPPA